MLIPSPAVCPSVDAGEQLAHPSSESRGAVPTHRDLVCFSKATPQMCALRGQLAKQCYFVSQESPPTPPWGFVSDEQ